MTRRIVVFGGTGFLGRRIVDHLLDRGFAVRAVSRHPEHGKTIFPGRSSELELVRADIGEDASISTAIADAFGVVNAVSLYQERSTLTFHAVHVEAAARLARLSQGLGIARLVHVSGIGADDASPSPYICSRGRGEKAVRAAALNATIVRPAVMFGPGDSFLNPLAGLLRRLPVFPMFGAGRTLLQPAYVEDVGEAIARIFEAAQPNAVYELAGPRTYTYRELLEAISARLGFQRVLLPVPFAAWHALAYFAEFLPQPPIAQNQIELMRVDNIASPTNAGFAALGIEPHGIDVAFAAR